MFWHRSFRLSWRQWTYAPEFRIPVYGPEDSAALLLALLLEEQRASGSEQSRAEAGSLGTPTRDADGAVKTTSETEPGGGSGQPVGPTSLRAPEAASDGQPAGPAPQDNALAIAICNGCFRIRRNAMQMAATAKGDGREGSKELRSISRALEKMDDFLKQSGVEYRDPTGQIYDPGR